VRPLVPLALGFALGILAGEATGLRRDVAACLAVVAALPWVCTRRGGRKARIAAGCAWIASAGALRIAFALAPPAEDSIAHRTGALPMRIAGRVGGLPEPNARGARIQVDAESAGASPAHGRLRLVVLEGIPPVLPGDRVEFRARLHPPRDYRNPGVPDRTLPDRARGVRAVAAVPRAADVTLLSRGPPGPMRAIAALRASLSRRLSLRTRGDARALLGALTLGERALISEAVETAFRRSGTTHLLSVSGVHLAAIALLCYAGLRRTLAWLPGAALCLRVRAAAAAVTIPVCALYALLAGAGVPVIRSTIMAGLLLSAAILDRAADVVSALALAALVLLAAEPGAIFDASFQLSFAACVGLALAPRVQGRGLASAITRMAAATGAASLCTAGLCAYHFGQVSLLGVLTNLVAIPYSTFVLLPAALLGLAVPSILPVAAVMAEVLIDLARLGAELPLASIPVSTPTLFEVLLLAAAPLLLLRGWPRMALLAACAVVLAGAVRHYITRVRDSARVTVLDVGQGDAVLIELPSRALLYDGGGGFDGAATVGDRAVLPALRARGVRRLDVVALSHPHPDHFGGLKAVLRELEVGALWTSGEPCVHPACQELFDLARRHGVPVRRPHLLVAGGARVEPLYPLPAYDPDMPTNDNSMVLRVSANRRHLLLAGDLEIEGELLLAAAAGMATRADVLKVPHHGSRTSSSEELLDAVRPRLAIISAGADNRFGFPHADVLERYRRRGIAVLRTDRHGAVTIDLGRRLEVRTVVP